MRHLIDTYVQAEEPRKISPFGNMGLLELIVDSGIAAIAGKLDNIHSKGTIAETIENNVRRKIIKEHLNDPALYDKMSKLHDEIIASRKPKVLAYEEYLKRIVELVKQVQARHADTTPKQLDTPGKRALYNNLLPKPHSGKVAEPQDQYNQESALKWRSRSTTGSKQFARMNSVATTPANQSSRLPCMDCFKISIK